MSIGEPDHWSTQFVGPLWSDTVASEWKQVSEPIAMSRIIDRDSILVATAAEHLRAHRPAIVSTGVVCSACASAWMCPAHAVAEEVLRSAGLRLSEHDRCDDSITSFPTHPVRSVFGP